MDYQKHYNLLVEKRKENNVVGYGENHHIIPKCMGGTDDSSNIVRLAAREHFVAHWLLTKIYPNNHKLVYSLWCMLRDPHGKRVFSSKYYEIAKKSYSKTRREMNKTANPMWTEEARKKISESMKGDNNPMRKYPEKNVFKGKSFVKGRKWYNNGEENLYLYPDEPVPDGYVRGMKFVKRKKSSCEG